MALVVGGGTCESKKHGAVRLNQCVRGKAKQGKSRGMPAPLGILFGK